MKNIKKEIKKKEKYKLENFSKLFLQIGLVVSLLIIFILFESRTEVYSPNNDNKDVYTSNYEEVDLIDFVIPNEPEPIKPKLQTKTAKELIPTKIIVVDKEPTFIPITPIDEPKTDQAPFINAPKKPQAPIIPETTTWLKIEKAPMYPGCEKHINEEAKRKCLQEKITSHISKHFNSDLANELNLNSGKNRIMVQFKIDQNGNIINIIAAAPHPKLKKEAVRIIGKLPKMTPGKQRNKPVIVKYALPINFIVE